MGVDFRKREKRKGLGALHFVLPTSCPLDELSRFLGRNEREEKEGGFRWTM